MILGVMMYFSLLKIKPDLVDALKIFVISDGILACI